LEVVDNIMGTYVDYRRVCLTYSAGGHYTELIRSLKGIVFKNSYHVTYYSDRFSNERHVNRYFIYHPRRRIYRFLINSLQALLILIYERPKIIISSGADVAVSTIILGKLLFRSQVIFIESAGDLSPTLSGRLVYHFSDLFIVQWPEKLKYFPKAKLSNGLLL
jgi:UDP-N-acetylglucosamine:LPS N-acetylglucosamine transferase